MSQIFELFLSGIAAGKQQEEHNFREWFLSSWSFVSFFTELRDRVSSECNSLHGVKCTAIVEHNRQSSHTEHSVVNFDLSDNFLSVLFPKLS